jgi:hypothetical protein
MIFAVDSSFGSFWELSRVSDESEQFGITFLLFCMMIKKISIEAL